MQVVTMFRRAILLFVSFLWFLSKSYAQNSYPTTGVVTLDEVTSRSNVAFWYGSALKAGGVMNGKIIHCSWQSGIGDFVDFYTAGNSADDISEKMRIIQNGNIGIGVKTPSQKLHVQGSGMFTDHISIGWAKELKTHGMLHNTIIKTGWEAGKDYTAFFVPGNSTDDASEKMRINQLGQVGIGTINVGSYKLAVEGKIGAREVNVTLASWSDFVFFDSYNLRPLSEVETFIQENKPLPDVPSAAMVEKEGVNLGEMDAILLRKIEELTLYVIEQNKKIEEVQKENEFLKERVKDLANK